MQSDILKRIRLIGIIISAVSVVALIMIISGTYPLALQGHLDCSQASRNSCTIVGHFPLETFAGSGALAALIILGFWMFIKSGREIYVIDSSNTAKSAAAKSLTNEEKTIYDMVIKNQGTIFQSDIVKNLGYSKVKISRLIDRLESKNLIERRRRGMANLIVLKSS